jgi:CRP/FNR family cyclic AMP-dependent transcriptional regulator
MVERRVRTADTAQIIEALQHAALFESLTETELARLAGRVQRFAMPPGPLFLEGDRAGIAYVLVSGRVDISLFSSDGRELRLYRVRPGDFFGELGLLDDQPRSASAIARTRCELLSLSGETLLDLISHNADVALRMIVSLTQRLRTADQNLKALSFLDMSARLARLLLTMDAEQGATGTVRVSQEELATALGSVRQSVTRTITVWRRMGYVQTGRSYVRILNRRKLRSYVVD